MKVSIIALVYNSADYVEQCMRSLAEQTLEDIEIIVVNDASQDDTLNIVERTFADYPQRKNQIKIVNHERNQGIGKAELDGLKAAQGEYILFIDGDDYIDVRMTEVMYEKAVSTSADTVICNFYRFDGTSTRFDTIIPQGVIGDGENVKDDIINRRVPPFRWCRLIRRSLFEEHDIIWPTGNLGEDTVIGAQTIYFSKIIASVDEAFYYYRYNMNSVSRKISEENINNNFNSFKQNVEIYLRFLERENVSEKYGRGVVINKLRTKNRLLPLTNQRKYRMLWWRTYSEINKVLLFGNKEYKPTFREWLWVGAIMTGLYCRFKRKLMLTKFIPSVEWL